MKIYNITPVPAPRMVKSDRWARRPCVIRYFKNRDELRRLGFVFKPSGYTYVLVLPMPQSWSKKKREEMNGKPHTSRPDIDNMIKSLMDASFKEDSHVYQVSVTKIWGYEGKIIELKDSNLNDLLTYLQGKL